MEPITDMYPSLPQVSIPKNPSPFAVFAAIRNTCLENKRKQDTILQMQSAAAWKEVEDSSSDPNAGGSESSSDSELAKKIANLPKIVGIGLQGVFEIIRESQNQYPSICRRALESLSDILGGLQPEELASEPPNVIGNVQLFSIWCSFSTHAGAKIHILSKNWHIENPNFY